MQVERRNVPCHRRRLRSRQLPPLQRTQSADAPAFVSCEVGGGTHLIPLDNAPKTFGGNEKVQGVGFTGSVLGSRNLSAHRAQLRRPSGES
ncbi:uncharacterized protein METZ01_LOCUS45382 [marine metagenome]|uniref:Uncharacterized protein n=1 Tax=marine metagenome TaxID=408172 RepID=A0A381RNK1_9ZZZZ